MAAGSVPDIQAFGSHGTDGDHLIFVFTGGCAPGLCKRIIGKPQVDPAGAEPTPEIVIDSLCFCDQQHIAFPHSGNGLVSGAGAGTDIHTVTGDGYLYTGLLRCFIAVADPGITQIHPAAVGELAPFRAVGIQIFAADADLHILHKGTCNRAIGRIIDFKRHQQAGRVLIGSRHRIRALPVGIEGLARMLLREFRDPAAACSFGIPAQELIVLSGRGGLHISGQIAVIALYSDTALAAVIIKQNVGITCGLPVGIAAVEVHIRLNESAVDQTGKYLTAGDTPLGQIENKFVAGGIIQNRLTEITVAVEPAGSAVVCKEHQGIKPVLGKQDIIAVGKPVQFRFHGGQEFPQQGIGFLFGNTVGIIALFTAAAVAYGIVRVIPYGVLEKAFHILQDLDTLFSRLHIGSCPGCQGKSRDQTKHYNQRKQRTYHSFMHRHTYSFTILYNIFIISAFFMNFNPFFLKNYIFVTFGIFSSPVPLTFLSGADILPSEKEAMIL